MSTLHDNAGWISGRIVRSFVAVAADAGLDADELLTRAQLLGKPPTLEESIPVSVHFDLWGYAVRELDQPGLPALAAAQRSTGDLQIRGFAIATSRTGWEACDRAARFAHLTTNTMSVSLGKPRPGVARISLLREGRRGLGFRCATECAVLSWITQIRTVLDPQFVPTRVCLQHRLPPDRSAHQAHAGDGAQLVGDAAFDGLEFAQEVLDRTPASSNPAMRAFFDAQAEAMLARLQTDRPPSLRRLDEIILCALPSGTPKMSDVAITLGLSERALRRTLEEHGTSFTDTVTAVRLQLARELLADPKLSFAEISFALGYSEHSAFTRFFRAQQGSSPSEYRTRLRARE